MHDVGCTGSTELVSENSLQILSCHSVGFSPMKVALSKKHDAENEETGQATEGLPYGYTGSFTLGAIFAHGDERPGNTRISVGINPSLGNQPDSHRAEEDSETLEPHPDDPVREGLSYKRDFGERSTFFAAPLVQIDTVIKLKTWRGIQRKFLAWAGSKPQGSGVWRVPNVSAKVDSVYFRTNHTLLGLGTSFYLATDDWDLTSSLIYRHANDGNLFLGEQSASFRFFNDWGFALMLYAGVKHQTSFEDSHEEEEEEPIEMKLGLMTAFGGSFHFDIPLRHLRIQSGVAAGSLHAKDDQRIDPVSQLFEPMPRQHFLVRPYGVVTFLFLPRGKMDLGFSWYGGMQSYVTDPGDASIAKRSNTFEVLGSYAVELGRAKHDIDLRFFAAYLGDLQRYYLPSGDLSERKDHLAVFGLQLFYGSLIPFRNMKTKPKTH